MRPFVSLSLALSLLTEIHLKAFPILFHLLAWYMAMASGEWRWRLATAWRRLGFEDLVLESARLRGFQLGARWALRIWAWTVLGFEDLGWEGAWLRRFTAGGPWLALGGLGLPWLAGLRFEDSGLGFEDLWGRQGPTPDRTTKPSFRNAKPGLQMLKPRFKSSKPKPATP